MTQIRVEIEKWVRIARKAVLALLAAERAVVWPEVEARLADRPTEGLPRGINPHHLATARTQLLREGQIESITVPTRGGRNVQVFGLANRRRQQRAFEDAAARKRLLYARYLSWAKFFGRAGERVVHASLLAAAPHGYRPVQPGGGEIKLLFGAKVPVGPLDNAALLQVVDDSGRPAGTVVVLIEVKNVRHWIYPESPELYELLDKASQLQLADQGLKFLPTLVCRRAHPTTFRMAKDLGFFVLDVRAQCVPPIVEIDPVHFLEVSNGLAFYDLLRSDTEHPAITRIFVGALPSYAPGSVQRFQQSAPILAQYAPTFRRQRPDQNDIRGIRRDAEAANLRDDGGW